MATFIKLLNNKTQKKNVSNIDFSFPDSSKQDIDSLTPVALTDFAQQVTPYTPISSQKAIRENTSSEIAFKLDWNESTIQPSPKVAAAISQFLSSGAGLNWYPELESASLLKCLEGYTGLSSNHLIATSGSDDALALLCSCFINPNDDVVIPVPTYNHFVVFAQAHGANIVEVLSPNPFKFNLQAILDKMTEHTRVVYLISPNNPTGSIAPADDVQFLCESYPHTLFILDEAYFEFSQVTGIHLVQKFKNLIVTRTFSKAFGLASLRVGYFAAHPELISSIKRLYNPKSVNSIAQVGAAAALEDIEYLNNFLCEVKISKELYREFFSQCPHIDATITPANFIVLKCDDPKWVLKKLESRHIYVRDRSNYPGMVNCLRMSVGNVEQTKEVIQRMRELFC